MIFQSAIPDVPAVEVDLLTRLRRQDQQRGLHSCVEAAQVRRQGHRVLPSREQPPRGGLESVLQSTQIVKATDSVLLRRLFPKIIWYM